VKKSRRHWTSVSVVLFLALGLLGSTFLFDLKPKLGLDLRGGLSVTLTAPEGTRADLLDKAVDILRGRVDQAGVAEPEISTESTNNIFIQLPGSEDPERLLRLIGKTAQLQFRQVERIISPAEQEFDTTPVSESDDPEQPAVLVDEEGNKYQLGKAELTGEQVGKGVARISPEGAWDVVVDFKRQGADTLQEFTGRLACEQGFKRQMAIVLDGKVESAPPMADTIVCNEGIGGGSALITGNFDEQEAKDLALVLTAGALPVKLTQSEVRTVSPTLGNDSLRAGLLAGAIGLLLVMIYVLVYYRTLGLQIWFGLIVFAAINYGLIVLFGELIGWNLTLAGIAGLIVSIGIAADSYIVFFERVKEEIHQGRSLRASIDRGFKHAWRTMLSANTVTILAALVLYFLAVGPVRGFALALGVATAIDLAMTYFLTWPLASLLAQNHFFAENKVMGMRRALEGGVKEGSVLRKFYRSEFNVDFIGRRRMWFMISGTIVLVSLIALIPSVRGLSYGIDFEGGTLLRAPAASRPEVTEVQNTLQEAGLDNPVVQIIEDRSTGRVQVQVQTGESLSEQERAAVIQALQKVTGAGPDEISVESVGEKWGASITTKALRGLFVFLILTILYMSWRLEPKMAAAGIIALLHDLIITAGVYAIVGFEVSPATVIATLTILGFSLYDTIVVFDKVQENQSLPANAKKSFAEIANDASNQVFMRSLSTSLTVLFPVGSLLFIGSVLLGADTLKDLALALFVGVAVGAYSSIFLATPLLSVWKEKEPRYATLRSRAVRQKAAVAPKEPEEESYEEPEEEIQEPVARSTSRTATAARSQPRKNQSRAKRKGKR
jgi:protein-export membrane protein SecD/preprotein translocase SecF subunit